MVIKCRWHLLYSRPAQRIALGQIVAQDAVVLPQILSKLEKSLFTLSLQSRGGKKMQKQFRTLKDLFIYEYIYDSLIHLVICPTNSGTLVCVVECIFISFSIISIVCFYCTRCIGKHTSKIRHVRINILPSFCSSRCISVYQILPHCPNHIRVSAGLLKINIICSPHNTSFKQLRGTAGNATFAATSFCPESVYLYVLTCIERRCRRHVHRMKTRCLFTQDFC
jgi:hypothetical protein